MPWTLDPPSEAESAVGDFVTQAYMELVRDAENIRSWSRKGGSGETTDVEAVQAAIDVEEDTIRRLLAGRYVETLYAEDATAISAGDALRLRHWAEVLASYRLYIGRGMRDDDAFGNHLTEQRDEVLAEIGQFADGVLVLDAEQNDDRMRMATLVKHASHTYCIPRRCWTGQ